MTKERMVPRSDAKLIAETCGDLADKVLHWKMRAIAAEEALKKLAAEIYGTPPASYASLVGDQ